MRTYGAWYDSNGVIRIVSFHSTRIPSYCAGVVELTDRVKPSDYYVDLTTLEAKPYPPKPTPRSIWDGTFKAWVMSLEKEKEAKIREITEARNKTELQGFTYLGKRFDSDAASVRRLNVAVLAAMNANGNFEIEWTCQDNSVITLNKNQLLAIPAVMSAQGDAIHKKGKKKKDDINNATTVEEVFAIKWDE